MFKLHSIIIGLVMTSLIMVGIMAFISGGTNSYVMTDYDNTTFEAFNQLDELQSDIETFEGNETDVKSDDSLTDILGNFFTSMYTSAKVFKGSVDVMTVMTDDGIDKLPLGDSATGTAFSTYLKTALALIFMTIITVGIFLAFVTKSDRT